MYGIIFIRCIVNLFMTSENWGSSMRQTLVFKASIICIDQLMCFYQTINQQNYLRSLAKIVMIPNCYSTQDIKLLFQYSFVVGGIGNTIGDEWLWENIIYQIRDFEIITWSVKNTNNCRRLWYEYEAFVMILKKCSYDFDDDNIIFNPPEFIRSLSFL